MARKKKSRREYGSGTITVNRKIGRYTVRWYDDKGDVHSCSRFALTDDGLAAAEEFLERANKAKQHPLSTTLHIQPRLTLPTTETQRVRLLWELPAWVR